MSVTLSHPDVQIRLSYEEDGEDFDFNWLQIQVSQSTIISLLQGLGVKGIDGNTYSVKTSEVIDAITQWDGSRLNNGIMAHKNTNIQMFIINKLSMLAMGCKIKGIEEITWG